MKKFLLFISLVIISLPTWAVKANWLPARVMQADGTWITVTLHGDEDFSWTTATDGALLFHQGNSYYVASVAADGTLKATSQLAHDPQLRSQAEKTLVSAQARELFETKATESMRLMKAQRQISIGTTSSYFPHSGTPKALVILVNFQDEKFTIADPVKTFNDYLNYASTPLPNYGAGENSNYGSVKKYFSDMSFGKFAPQFDVKGPVTVSNTMAYYGQNSGSRKDIHYTDMIREACQLVDDSVNFADYDADGDGKVDLLYIIYAGYSESFAQNSSDCLWPKSGTVDFTFDNTKIYRFGINNELNGYPGCYTKEPLKRVNGIGLFCHEFSHTMGLPDLYPTVASAMIDNQGMEYWDLMDGGEYIANGHYPAPYTPWERETMGWITTDTLKEACQVKLAPVQYGGKAYKILSDSPSKYLIVENLQQAGWYRRMPGQGLMVYKINYPRTTVNLSDYPNNTAGAPGLTIVPADGLLLSSYTVTNKISEVSNDASLTATQKNQKVDSLQTLYLTEMAGDPFPGTTNVTELSGVSIGTTTIEKPLYNIAMTDDGYITFDFLKQFPTGISNVTIGKQTDGRIYSIDGRLMGADPARLPKGLYIRNHKKFVVR